MAKVNCWEAKKCGREQGGPKASELGTCPAYLESKLNTINGGKNGGRACWVVAGTLCGGKTQGTYASKEQNCLGCDFYKKVKAEEGYDFVTAGVLLNKL